ncbi:MAG TPA: DUF3237 domain-containing protein [Methylibium sp.]|uniref:DUF3237 domain-containing protein n=1 Tax=Methylibium sp. TaxID=2067992 RepID=UPI002DBC41D9|nr:DUF3237 domain-containing protein [Methylibium sp.]HEU4460533.1 DUF3237 domain-containing protein [Methylibium sp.]
MDAPLSLHFMARIRCEVGPLVSLGAAPIGERRYVPLLGGTAEGPALNGAIEPGGVDWQVLRRDGVLEIAAHYVLRADDGGRIEIISEGLRHGPPEAMARLARGEAVAPADYFFRTLMRFQTGAPAWLHLNRTLALASGTRSADAVELEVHRIG